MSKFIGLMAMAVLFACTPQKKKNTMIPNDLPAAPVAEKIDSTLTIHDHTRVDPYFWMRLSDEQKNAESPDEQTQKVIDYLNAENAYTKAAMVNTEKLQEKLFNEIVGRIKKDDESVPYFSNGYWYYSKFEEGNEYRIHCRKKGSLDAVEEVFFNENERAEGKPFYGLGSLSISKDNKMLAFAEDFVSRRIYTIRFKNLETGEILPDVLENAQGGGAWANDHQTYFYTTKNEVSLLSEKIWRHKLGTPVKNDVMVYHETDPSFYIGVGKTKSDQYIVIGESATLETDYWVLDANDPNGEFKQFTPRIGEHEYYIEHHNDKWFITTNHEANNFRLMETPVNATELSNWKEVIPHRKDVLLDEIEVFNDHLVVSERKDALTHLRIINQKTKEEHYLDFGEEVYVSYISTNPEFNTNLLRFGYSSMTTPTSTIDYDMDAKTKTVKKVQDVVGGHEPANYVTERLWVTEAI